MVKTNIPKILEKWTYPTLVKPNEYNIIYSFRHFALFVFSSVWELKTVHFFVFVYYLQAVIITFIMTRKCHLNYLVAFKLEAIEKSKKIANLAVPRELGVSQWFIRLWSKTQPALLNVSKLKKLEWNCLLTRLRGSFREVIIK